MKALLSWAAAFLLGLTLLSACVAEGPGPAYPPGPNYPDYPPAGPRPRPEPDRFCSRQYDPVCASRGGERQTFPNQCEADRAGYRVVRDGECRSDREPPREQNFCTREYAPVCGRRDGQLRTFPNECEADAAGYRVVDDEGPC